MDAGPRRGWAVGRGFGPDFIFSWPNARTAVMGGEQAARVMSIVTREKWKRMGKVFDESDEGMLAAIEKQSPAENQEESRRIAKMFRRIWSFPRPLIAAVNGPAYAGGCGIATLCDFTLAVPEAKFGYTEVKIGFLPAIVSVFLTRQIGDKRSRDLLLTGRIIEAEEAKTFGLVSEIVPAERLMERAHELANLLIAASPSSLTRSKHLLVSSAAAGVDHDLERAILENARIRCTPDFQEGLASFLEKRKPVWQGDSEK